MKAYEALAALEPLTATQAAQCELPLRLGGRGLRSQERLAPAARVGSWARYLAEVALGSGVDSLEDIDASELRLAAARREALAALPAPSPAARMKATLPRWYEPAQAP